MTELLFGQTPSNDPHWQLLWQDDFNTLNTNIWNVANNFDHYGNELQVYTNRADNIFINNGNLVLRAKFEDYSCPSGSYGCVRQNTTGQHYSFTSAWVETQPTYLLHYGYVEAKIKLPYGKGFWPAFWTFTDNPSYQEIDIFEMTQGALEECHRTPEHQFRDSIIHAGTNIHLLSCDTLCCDDPYSSPSTYLINDFTQWHTYGLEWSPTRIIWYVDGYPVRYFQNTSAGLTAPTSIILNLAISSSVAVVATFPADMLIDYVKVYELNSDCSDFINTTNYNFSTYDNIEKNFIKIGHGGGNNSLINGQDVKLRASEFIELSGDFYVPLGASLFLDGNMDCPDYLNLQCTQTFNPCVYDFSNYDNSVKKIIDIGGAGCPLTINSTTNDILLEATNSIVIKPNITITPNSNQFVELKIVSCD